MTYPAWHLPVTGGYIGGIANQADGPDVLFLPGAGTSAGTWAPVFDQLAELHVVALDRRGVAQSIDAPVLEDWAAWRDAVHVIESMFLERPVLVGHNSGATIALTVATERPDLVSAVVALDTVAPSADNPMSFAQPEGVRVVSADEAERRRSPHPDVRVVCVEGGHRAHHSYPDDVAAIIRSVTEAGAYAFSARARA
ncbi:MAG: alpha/beta fold hydrolase [Dermatophilus congolensis]|nr:alpha/beta fold hydrolase [Dermatophilus congolensis]